MTNATDVEHQNATEQKATAERNRRLREDAILRGDLAQWLPAGTASDVVRLVEHFLRLDDTQRAALLAALEKA